MIIRTELDLESKDGRMGRLSEGDLCLSFIFCQDTKVQSWL